ncbi:MAG: heme-binding protein [Rhodospirillaceae bacterium]|nr:heme-binding protein [Rhodospirillaceae bacterium]
MRWMTLLLSVLAIVGSTARAQEVLTTLDVNRILEQAASEAEARGRPATIAVVDRVGNVLGVYQMTGANSADPGFAALGIAADPRLRTVTVVSNPRGADTGLNGLAFVPDTMAAITKAVTGAYLSSQGNAFSTRTASQIVQDHFNPGEANTPSGPLFGVQVSQLPCSDLNRRLSDGTVGPKRSPLGLSADPGGFPLYKNGTLVGGIGAIADGSYGVDVNIFDRDQDIDELIALAGSIGFEAPVSIRADRITVDGKLLRFSNAGRGHLVRDPASPRTLRAIAGSVIAVPGYFPGMFQDGEAFPSARSGYVRDDATYGTPAVVLVDQTGAARFSPQAGSDLAAAEVRTILRHALAVAGSARAQIRNPLGSSAQVTISVVDGIGRVLGLVRTLDAPVFGTDVSLQKARSAAFLSSTEAASYIRIADGARTLSIEPSLLPYLAQAQALLGINAFADGVAMSARAIGNLARPTFPDGIGGTPNGPLSRSASESTPASTGLQLDLVFLDIAGHVLFVRGNSGSDVSTQCTRMPAPLGTRVLANGLQIFPGGVPIYRGQTLVGAIGVSGDGIDQDDMIAFLGLHRAAIELGSGLGNAPPARRADQLAPRGVRLRYVSCPVAAFLGSRSSNVCAGL